MSASRRKAFCSPAGGDSKGAALARGKRLPPEKTDEIAPRKGVNFVAFPVPEKPLAACYPGLGDGQRCSAARAPQAQNKGGNHEQRQIERNRSAALHRQRELVPARP